MEDSVDRRNLGSMQELVVDETVGISGENLRALGFSAPGPK